MESFKLKSITLAGLVVSTSVMAQDQHFVNLANNVAYVATESDRWANQFFDENHKENYRAIVNRFGAIVSEGYAVLEKEGALLASGTPMEQKFVEFVSDFYRNLKEIHVIFETSSSAGLVLKLAKHGDIDYIMDQFEKQLEQLRDKSVDTMSQEVTDVLDKCITVLKTLRTQWLHRYPNMNPFKWGNRVHHMASKRHKQ